MQTAEQWYLSLLQKIMTEWIDREERTGIWTRSIFWSQIRYDLSKWFPLFTTKKIFLKGIIHELLRFISGDTNIRYLVKNGVNIWNEWAFTKYIKHTKQEITRYTQEWDDAMKKFIEQIIQDEEFAKTWWDLWPVYGKQRRAWDTASGWTVDQLQVVLDLLKNDPSSRRIIISWWNVWEIQELIHNHDFAPPPCHTLFQFYVVNGTLSCQLYQRSADMFLWVPFNVASYALLTMMIAQVCGFACWEFIHTMGDSHIYLNHIDQVKEQLSREPRNLPIMKINSKIKNLFDFTYEDFTLEGYDPHPAIKAPIAI